MSQKRTGLMLSIGRIWVMGLPFRLVRRSRTAGFWPGAVNLIAYESRRLWHRLYERERLLYLAEGLRSWSSRLLGRH